MHIFAASLPNLRRRAARGGSVGRVYRVGNAHLIPVRPTSDLRSYARYSQRFRRIHRCFAAFRGRFAGVSRAFRGRFAGVSPKSQAYKSIRTGFEPYTLSHSFALFRKIRVNFAKFRKFPQNSDSFRSGFRKKFAPIRSRFAPFRAASRRLLVVNLCKSLVGRKVGITYWPTVRLQ